MAKEPEHRADKEGEAWAGGGACAGRDEPAPLPHVSRDGLGGAGRGELRRARRVAPRARSRAGEPRHPRGRRGRLQVGGRRPAVLRAGAALRRTTTWSCPRASSTTSSAARAIRWAATWSTATTTTSWPTSPSTPSTAATTPRTASSGSTTSTSTPCSGPNYTDPEGATKKTKEQVAREKAGVGGSVVRVKKGGRHLDLRRGRRAQPPHRRDHPDGRDRARRRQPGDADGGHRRGHRDARQLRRRRDARGTPSSPARRTSRTTTASAPTIRASRARAPTTPRRRWSSPRPTAGSTTPTAPSPPSTTAGSSRSTPSTRTPSHASTPGSGASGTRTPP